MATLAYRLTVYATDDTTALAPIAGAAHSDSFKVASISGVTGFQPYLESLTGRSGRIDPVQLKTDTGSYTVRLMDARVTPGGSNAIRWVTAFLGDANGKPRLFGRKVYIEESEDGGATWSAFFTGRIRTTRLAQSRLWWEFEARDFRDALKADTFAGRPNSTIACAIRPSLVPTGLEADYGPSAAAPVLSGAVKTDGFGNRYILLDATNGSNAILTKNAAKLLEGGVIPGMGGGGAPLVQSSRARVKIDGVGEYQVAAHWVTVRGY
ncbi:MAG TPA: hypothetical protein VKD22_11360, partial [Ramlibacter sp.]|nr:hypothetical protein [Ramlibacter sp.]